jgi:hypothetical protein
VTSTIGAVNFLFDPAQTPHLNSRELCALFGVSQSACAAKSREIRRIFDIGQLDPRWCLPSKLVAYARLEKKLTVDKTAILTQADVRLLTREVQRLLTSSVPGLSDDVLARTDDTIRWRQARRVSARSRPAVFSVSDDRALGRGVVSRESRTCWPRRSARRQATWRQSARPPGAS